MTEALGSCGFPGERLTEPTQSFASGLALQRPRPPPPRKVECMPAGEVERSQRSIDPVYRLLPIAQCDPGEVGGLDRVVDDVASLDGCDRALRSILGVELEQALSLLASGPMKRCAIGASAGGGCCPV